MAVERNFTACCFSSHGSQICIEYQREFYMSCSEETGLRCSRGKRVTELIYSGLTNTVFGILEKSDMEAYVRGRWWDEKR